MVGVNSLFHYQIYWDYDVAIKTTSKRMNSPCASDDFGSLTKMKKISDDSFYIVK